MNIISEIINNFDVISLAETDAVSLLNRFDTKYQLTIEKLCSVLTAIKNDYYVLEHNKERMQKYRTVYFDTEDNSLYLKHHNGKLNRIKIRKREYVNSGIAFLELKIKNNKGKTNKLRIQTEDTEHGISSEELGFITRNTAFSHNIHNNVLAAKNLNTFKRITLVNKNFQERCTIDIGLTCYSENNKISFSNMVIIELKQEIRNMKSTIAKALKKQKVKKQGFSKYCIGRAFLEPELKINLFKEKLLQLNKQYHIKHASYPSKSLTTEKRNNDADVNYNFERTTQAV